MKKTHFVSGLLCTALVFGCGDDGTKPTATGGATNMSASAGNTDSSTGDSTDSGSTTSAGSVTNPSGDNPTSTGDTTGFTVTGNVTESGPTSDTGTGTGTCESFLCPLDQGPMGDIQCDPWSEDCPSGEKCMPYSGDGDPSWESLKCVPIDPNPGTTGDACTVEGNGVSGVDSCDLHHMCWNVNQDTGEGTCVKFCNGSKDAPSCDVPGTACTIANGGVLILCLPACDPILQDCPGGELCLPNPENPDSFICVLDASGEEGQENDPCEYANVCDPGYFCANPAVANECDPGAAGCCTAFCDLKAPQCNNAGVDCLPWYEPGTEPPNYAHVGYCALPG